MINKTELRDTIMREVLAQHGITRDEFFCRSNWRHLVEARIEVARKLSKAGFGTGAISRIMGRNYRSVSRYIHPRYEPWRRDRARAVRTVPKLHPQTADIVSELAAKRGISIVALTTEWIMERAEYETRTRAA